MKTFGREELIGFLRQIDEQLEEPVAMEIIIERLFGPSSARTVGMKGRPKAKRRGSGTL
jgi:hypothetical protein